ncbi:hypothetical protein VTN00DRAFT_7891 [Thermoascus crustaceus]|uniref:uncharacterized protein n=1 Tax=Thermoascus crustaceus TaxID=5088 RepID=UPI00374326BB
MAANVPANLKPADIGRFALRAAQIERAKPVIAYWCNYWVVNKIIEKGLHMSDEESLQYTTNLMDKLEQFKSENSDNDAVTDNVAAQAYVEQFGLEVFNRADNAVRANKASRQTADTFQAAATFLELCQIWGQLDPEIAAKIKFAKYHAVRIAKAIKAGEDPNLSNPAPEGEDEQALDPSDPDVKALQDSTAPPVTKPGQPSVEEVPDESDAIERRLAQQSSLNESIHPSRSSSIPPQRTPAQATAPDLPSAPTDFVPSASVPNLPDTPATSDVGATPPTVPPSSFQSFPPPVPNQAPSVPDLPRSPSTFYGAPTPGAQPSAPAASPPWNAPGPSSATPRPARVPAASTTSGASSAQVVDDQSIALAQKHARWAVSALSFDDVNTAIKELRNSLRYLGAE